MTPRSSRDGRRLAAGSHAHGGMNVNQLVDHAVSSCQGGGGRGVKWGGSAPFPWPTNLRTGVPVSHSPASELLPSLPVFFCFNKVRFSVSVRLPCLHHSAPLPSLSLHADLHQFPLTIRKDNNPRTSSSSPCGAINELLR